MIQQYSKFIAAAIGLGVLFAARHGVDLSGNEQLITDAALSIATAVAVWWARNKPPQT